MHLWHRLGPRLVQVFFFIVQSITGLLFVFVHSISGLRRQMHARRGPFAS